MQLYFTEQICVGQSDEIKICMLWMRFTAEQVYVSLSIGPVLIFFVPNAMLLMEY